MPVPVVAIIAAVKGFLDFIHNKDRENSNLLAGRQKYNDFYNNPQVKAQQAAVREYWNAHGLQGKAEAMGRPNMLEELLAPQPFREDNQAYKIPGAGGKLADDLLGAAATTYKANQGKTPEFAGPPGESIAGGSSSFGRPGLPALPSADRAAGGGMPLDATRNDPAAIFESIFGAGEGPSPVNVSDPSRPWIDPLKRFYYPGQPTRTQGL
jgi:hypothetical protein